MSKMFPNSSKLQQQRVYCPHLQLVYHCSEDSRSEMSFVKQLCVLCERPTADGAVQAVQLDKEKLLTWFFNVCGFEFSDEIDETDLICNFCIWHAEFLAKHDGELEALTWWSQDLTCLDEEAKELRKKYLEGKAEQCWVQLEKIELPKSETEENAEHEANPDGEKSKKKCFYCGKVVAIIIIHMRKMHANAIRCDYHKCATYFHTVEEKESHTEEVHGKKLVKCNFCEKQFRWSVSIRRHIRQFHSEFLVRCNYRGCLSYFKTESDMKIHFDSAHNKEDDEKVLKCQYCEHKTSWNNSLKIHISRFHLPMSVKCDKCGKMFASKQLLAQHLNEKHLFRMCKICNSNDVVRYRTRHLNKTTCQRCKNEFECSGLYQSHLETCKKTLFKCLKCPKTYKKHSSLKYHLKIKHRNNSWHGLQHKKLGFKCEPCKRYYKNAESFKKHLNRFHKRLNLKQCAHCPKSFTDFTHLKNHLAEKHNLIERKFECGECQKKFVSSYFLAKHKRRTHLLIINLKSCKVCGKSMGERWLKTHLLTFHGICSP